ncbi:hypothetical protein KUTeg_003183, partial [Tegillarca granosa]
MHDLLFSALAPTELYTSYKTIPYLQTVTVYLQPSQSCGPFRIHQHAITVFYSAVNGLLMLIPVNIIIFYYWMVAAGYAKMEKILCEQLQM